MNAAWQCACCKRDLWALQQHTCESCAEVVCIEVETCQCDLQAAEPEPLVGENLFLGGGQRVKRHRRKRRPS